MFKAKKAFAAFLLPFLVESHSSAPHQWKIHCITSLHSFEGVGVTSIHSSACIQGQNREHDIYSIHVGTKRGSLKRITWSAPYPGLGLGLGEERTYEYLNMNIHDYTNTNGFALKRYPIYSMIHLPEGNNHFGEGGGVCSTRPESILCGGGDRYITVWNNMNMNIQGSTNSEKEQGTWKTVNQLGPHTGWVKDMAYYSPPSSDNSFLFSIGCNCIEIWKMNCNHAGTLESESTQWSWQHDSKLEIESSLEMGCTLSSDLLCLEVCNTNTEDRLSSSAKLAYLFAGGVDGRLHRWKLDGSLKNAEHISAHQGRVNGILVCEVFNALVSIGSDGVLLCKSMSDGLFEEWDGASLDLNQSIMGARLGEISDSIVKITSLCRLREDYNEATIVVGCSSGLAVPVELTRLEGVLNLKMVDKSVMKLEEESTIHALEVIHRSTLSKNGKNHEYNYLIAGTSKGLSIWELDYEESNS